MCGIVGYVGNRDAANVIVSGLRRLEYRGYDSAGIALLNPDSGAIDIVKTPGKIAALEQCIAGQLPPYSVPATLGIGHTRWATHGAPNQVNAHPHRSRSGDFAVVHNGIIENYQALKSHLIPAGFDFLSETDTEVIAHLVEQCYEGDLTRAVAAACERLVGTYGIAVISRLHPGTLVAARKGSPIAVGVCADETIVASDISAIVQHTDRVIFLNDGDLLTASGASVEIVSARNVPVSRETTHIDWDVGQIEKGGYDHFMLKEISYIHAEGYQAAELKHGPIALLGEDVPVVALAPETEGRDKSLSNMQECRARRAPVVAIATEGDDEVLRHCDDVIRVPRCQEFLTPIPVVIAEQLLAYHVARIRGCPIDQPRNLAKSVTVE